MNTQRFYVVDQDNKYYVCKSEHILFDDVLRRFSFDQIGLTLNDKHVTCDYGYRCDSGDYYYKRRTWTVDIVVFDALWRVVNHEKLQEIYDRVQVENAAARQRRYFGRHVGDPVFRYDPIPHTGRNRWSFGHYYRSQIKTTNERRQSFACDPKYIRKKRNYVSLPNVWDDYPRSDRGHDKSWKKTKKKKQWL